MDRSREVEDTGGGLVWILLGLLITVSCACGAVTLLVRFGG